MPRYGEVASPMMPGLAGQVSGVPSPAPAVRTIGPVQQIQVTPLNSIDASIIPVFDNTYDIGSSVNRFKDIWCMNLYAQTKVRVGGVLDVLPDVIQQTLDTARTRLAGGSVPSDVNGAYAQISGNSYLATQRGVFQVIAGNPGVPTGNDGTIGFYTGASALRWQIDRSGHLVAGTDAVYDIGSGASRPRNVYARLGFVVQNVADTTGATLVRAGADNIQLRSNDDGAGNQQDATKPSYAITLGEGVTDALAFFRRPPAGAYTRLWQILATGHLAPGADNTYDIGSGVFRPRNIEIVGNFILGGNITCNGATKSITGFNLVSSSQFQALHATIGLINASSQQLVSTVRKTGWTAATGTATRTTFATGTVTLIILAEHVKALVDDLISHGLIGT